MDGDASLLDCYALSSGATVTKFSKDHSAVILMVRQSKNNHHPFTQQQNILSHITCISGNTAVRTSNLNWEKLWSYLIWGSKDVKSRSTKYWQPYSHLEPASQSLWRRFAALRCPLSHRPPVFPMDSSKAENNNNEFIMHLHFTYLHCAPHNCL